MGGLILASTIKALKRQTRAMPFTRYVLGDVFFILFDNFP